MAKVDVFSFTTLSNIFGKIGGLYSMLTLLSGITLMYKTRVNYLNSIVVQIQEEYKYEDTDQLKKKIKNRMQTKNIYKLYDTIESQQMQLLTQGIELTDQKEELQTII